MAGVKALRRIQLGAESTAGTAVDATALWRGKGMIEDRRETKFTEEDIGYLSDVDRTYVPKLLAAITFDNVEATFEQLGYVLNAGVKVASGVADTGGSGYVYTYTFPVTDGNTIKTYTIEGGDNQEVEEIEHAFVRSFRLSGKPGEAWMVGAEWEGRQVTTSAFTGSIALPAVEEILFSKTKLYIDAADGTAGTTLKSNTLLGAELRVNTGLQAVFAADGELYFSFVKPTRPEILLSVTFEHDGSAVAEKGHWRAQTARLLRLAAQGSAFTTAGTYSNKAMVVDLAGKWEAFSKIDEQDGNDIITGSFRARYNATAAKFAQIVLVNGLSALP